jgi:hypothetical protein
VEHGRGLGGAVRFLRPPRLAALEEPTLPSAQRSPGLARPGGAGAFATGSP